MAKIDLSTITDPISEEQPCGPDLDMEMDMDFMNLIAEAEGDLPTSYFKFVPGDFKFEKYYDRIGEFMDRTHDVRLLVILAKLRILHGDLGGFTEAVVALGSLLTSHWTDAHPQAMDGDLSLRMGYLFTLDDNPNLVLPLQHNVLIRSRRSGTITYRKWQVAHGDVNPREGEDKLDTSAIISALSEADDDEIAKIVANLESVRDALAAIRKIAVEEAGFEAAVSLDRLPPVVDGILAMIAQATGQGEAVEAAEGEAAEDGGGTVLGSVILPPGAATSREEVKEALHLAARYFALNEPSSPIQLLLREAEAAVEKGFYSLVQDLTPATAGSTTVRLGEDPYFTLSIQEMDTRNPAPDYSAEVGEKAAESLEDTGLGDDESVSEEVDDAARSEAAESAEEESAGEAESVAEESTEEVEQAEQQPVENEPAAGEAAPKFWANTRPEAVALMEKVVAYYKVAEPSSPIPLLLQRAIEMSSKSFMEILGSVMPVGSLLSRDID